VSCSRKGGIGGCKRFPEGGWNEGSPVRGKTENLLEHYSRHGPMSGRKYVNQGSVPGDDRGGRRFRSLLRIKRYENSARAEGAVECRTWGSFGRVWRPSGRRGKNMSAKASYTLRRERRNKNRKIGRGRKVTGLSPSGRVLKSERGDETMVTEGLRI